MKHSIVTFFVAAALANVACNGDSQSQEATGGAVDAKTPDRSGTPLAGGDRGESEDDRVITAQVRRDVVADETLSVSAKHVKIITRNGAVTLRGPVISAAERSRIAGYARRVAGVWSVNDLLEVASN